MKNNKMVKYPLILGLVALVAGLLLAVVYNVTKPVIDILFIILTTSASIPPDDGIRFFIKKPIKQYTTNNNPCNITNKLPAITFEKKCVL